MPIVPICVVVARPGAFRSASFCITSATVRSPEMTSSIRRNDRGCAAASGTTVSGSTTVPRNGKIGILQTLHPRFSSAWLSTGAAFTRGPVSGSGVHRSRTILCRTVQTLSGTVVFFFLSVIRNHLLRSVPLLNVIRRGVVGARVALGNRIRSIPLMYVASASSIRKAPGMKTSAWNAP